MKLHWSPRSPYVRKVMIAAHELGLAEKLELIRSVAVMTSPNPAIMADNPLNKIPTLVLDDGRPLFDSLTICEFLNHMAGGALFPPPGPERWDALMWHSAASGLTDVLILWRNEREKPPSAQTPEWLAAFALKTRSTLAFLQAERSRFDAASFGIGHIAIGCCLAYMDFRFADLDWRSAHPDLKAWFDDFTARPSFKATEIDPNG